MKTQKSIILVSLLLFAFTIGCDYSMFTDTIYGDGDVERGDPRDTQQRKVSYWLRKDPFLGLQGLSWHHTESNYIKENWLHKPENFHSLPVALSGYTPMQCEEEIRNDPENLTGLLEQVCLNLVPWYYKRNLDVSKYSNVVITDDMVICPILWEDTALMAYSKETNIIDMKFRLPSTWGDVQEVQMFELTLEGLKPLSVIKTTNIEGDGRAFQKMIHINIKKGNPVVFKPMFSTI